MMNNLTFGGRLEFQSGEQKPIYKALWKWSHVITSGLKHLNTLSLYVLPSPFGT